MTPTYDTDAAVYSPGAEIGLNVENASPPTAAYVGKDDLLLIETSCSQGPPLVTVGARLLMPDGSIIPSVWTFTPNLQRPAQFTEIQLPECFILSLSVSILLTNSGRSVYIAAQLIRGYPANVYPSQILCQGYVSTNMPLSWPNGFNTDNLNCVGNIRSITGTLPAAGANISETVPTGAKWRPISFLFTLTTSAAVATRIVVLTVDDGTNVFFNAASSSSQAASLAYTYTFTGQVATGNTGALVVTVSGFLGLVLNPGYRIKTVVTGLQAGDQLSAPQYLVEEWLIP